MMNDDIFNNPYRFAAALANRVQKFSKVSIGTNSIYSLICNAVLSELIKDSYIPGRLELTRNRKVQTSAFTEEFAHNQTVLSELRSTTIMKMNRDTRELTLMHSYSENLELASRLSYVSVGILPDLFDAYTLTRSGQAAQRRQNVFLRAIYTHLAHVASHEHSSGVESSILEHLGEDREAVKSSLISRNYGNFRRHMERIIVRDPKTITSLLLPAVRQSLLHVYSRYNHLLTTIVAYQYVLENPVGTDEQHKALLAEICESSLGHVRFLLQFSPKLTDIFWATYAADIGGSKHVSGAKLYEIMRKDNRANKLLSSPTFKRALMTEVAEKLERDVTRIELHAHQALGNLERVAAAILLFYPGCDFTGADIALEKDRVRLLNVEEGKIVPVADSVTDHSTSPFFDERRVSRETQTSKHLLLEVRHIFSNFRAHVAPLRWDQFVVELKKLCRDMSTHEFATAAQSSILEQLRSIEHLSKLDDRIGQISYNSFLPRVRNIESFLSNESLVDFAECLIQLTPEHGAPSRAIAQHLIGTYSPTRIALPSSQDATRSSGDGDSEQHTHDDNARLLRNLKAKASFHQFQYLSKYEARDASGPGMEASCDDSAGSSNGATPYTPEQLETDVKRAILNTAARRSLKHMLEVSAPFAALCCAVMLVAAMTIFVTCLHAPLFVTIPVLTSLFLGLGVAAWLMFCITAKEEHRMSVITSQNLNVLPNAQTGLQQTTATTSQGGNCCAEVRSAGTSADSHMSTASAPVTNQDEGEAAVNKEDDVPTIAVTSHQNSATHPMKCSPAAPDTDSEKTNITPVLHEVAAPEAAPKQLAATLGPSGQ
ncbi:hypothetical protein OC188_04525 [Anaplasma capra]|uniref:hypothetical protein n=1 Tax=Anaplasma capra TaxID=1562740 RepID=UPI0021D5DEF6|nr:hypothetical protein [Anaplasma capra]MCU7611952.1 hypothetical protein [Anaplasma capra]